MIDIKEIRETSGLSRAAFSRKYNIPVRTLEDWEAGRRSCPGYVKELLEKVVKEDERMARNWNEMFRFESDASLESIKAGLREATGEDDFLGFEDVEDQQEYLERCFRDGFLVQDGDFVAVIEIK